MSYALWLLAALSVSTGVPGEEGAFIPWNQFESLYRGSVEREVMKEVASQQKTPQVFSINDAGYSLNVTTDVAQGEAAISGKVISGDPEPIALFGHEAVITAITEVTGGTILCMGDQDHTLFLPDGTSAEFQIKVAFLLRAQEDGGVRVLSLSIPPAIRNSLVLKLPAEARLIESPGMAGPDGLVYFPATNSLNVKYVDKKDMAAAVVIEIDALSRITVQRNRVLIASTFVPLRPVPDVLTLVAPKGAKYLGASLSASRVKELGEDRFALTVPSNEQEPFSVEFALDTPTDDGETSLLLPIIESNTGQQGRFLLNEPDDRQITVSGTGLVTQIPIERLGEALAKVAAPSGFFMKTTADQEVTLGFKRFTPVSTPTTVLECQYVFCSFEENGNVLTTVAMDVPAEFGARLTVKAVPDAEIWSLAVNGAKRQVYAEDKDTWVIPLDNGGVSHVELAFLKRGNKLGLQGRLDVVIPEIGIPSQDVRVGIALPPRVELLSMEGPVSPDPGKEWKTPAGFIGKPHFFSRSFYKGEGMALAVAYKEPVDQRQQKEGGKQ